MAKSEKNKKLGKPNILLYTVGCLVLYPIYKVKYGLSIDKSGIKDLKGPALVLGQHLSGKDHVTTGLALFPHRVNFVGSRHFLLNPTLRRVFRWMKVITKKMFCADISAVKNILKAKQEGNIIVMFPEGRLPSNGISVPVTDGSSELVKKLGIDVYMIRGEGAYKSFPKWGLKRRGKIVVKTEKIFSADEIPNLSVEEIAKKLDEVFTYNDEDSLKGIEYKVKDTTKGLSNLLWKCPSCGNNWSLVTENGKISCGCGLDASMDTKYQISGTRFSRISDWYKWQTEELMKEADSLEDDVIIGTPGEDGNLIENAGFAHVFMDKEHFTLSGKLLGEDINLDKPIDRIGGFPITVGKHVDIYHEGNMLYLYPKKDPRTSIMWVAFHDYLIS